jgi:hypothetical protein
MRSRFRPSPAMIVACLSLLVALGGAALAASVFVGSDGKIHGCVDQTGQLSLVKPGKSCKKGQHAIAWNQRGRRGPAGAPGTARAFAYVTADAKIDPARSKGVLGVAREVAGTGGASTPPGVYCFKLGFHPRSAVATTTRAARHIVTVDVPPDVETGTPTPDHAACPAGFQDAEATAFDPGDLHGANVDTAFYIVFN